MSKYFTSKYFVSKYFMSKYFMSKYLLFLVISFGAIFRLIVCACGVAMVTLIIDRKNHISQLFNQLWELKIVWKM